ncbi:MAG TPA: aldolase/citrate lyase family protein [Candidatus Limnocylindrales bacterium]|nr:aldolase/citrate lyase family protein [Candidatus Limnocylindrales bacterium]
MIAADRRPLRGRILEGETLFGLFLDLGSPISAELASRAGYDWLVIDLEHGAATEADLLLLLHAVEAGGATPLVRPQSGERLRIGRALDMGARGIIVPRLNSAEEAREVVSFLRYPPEGVRGVALRARGADLGAFTHDRVGEISQRIVGLVQIESTGALADADAIAAIDGVDVLFVGPADLSHSLGVPGRFTEPIYRDALTTVVAACRAHGKAAGILVYDPAVVSAHLELGFRFVGIGSDGAFIADGAGRSLAAVRPAAT